MEMPAAVGRLALSVAQRTVIVRFESEMECLYSSAKACVNTGFKLQCRPFECRKVDSPGRNDSSAGQGQTDDQFGPLIS